MTCAPKRTSSPWIHAAGFAIDHVPALLLINCLGVALNSLTKEHLVLALFTSHPCVADALIEIFPNRRPIPDVVPPAVKAL